VTEPNRPARDTSPRQGGRKGGRRKGRGGRGADGAPVVPDVEFTSYYGRPVVKVSPWEKDIPAYLFLGGLAGGSSLLAAGADLTNRPALRRTGRLGALTGLALSMIALVHDLGRPSRFLNMLRVIKPTSPMSIGTWLLSAYGPGVGVAAAAELAPWLPMPRFVRRLLAVLARPAGLGAAITAPAVASYTAVLLADTASPAWHSAHRELPYVFVSSAACASGGLGMLGAPVHEAGPARRLAVLGAVAELAVETKMEQSMGLPAETLHHGKAGQLMKASKALTVVGALGAATIARRSRVGAALSGAALMAGSACTRFGIFEAGQESARDPKYTVVPQRERLEARKAQQVPPAEA
jgi:formate-dependent nitrite reductase membrane component NrfD